MTARQDHTELALARLPEKFRTKPKIRALITAMMSTKQSLEDAAIDVLTLFALDNATGFVLDALGKRVGQRRNGLDDDAYRRYIRARIATNRSSGTVNELIRVTRLVIDDSTLHIVLKTVGAATLRVRIEGVLAANVADILISFLVRAKAGGVRLVLEFNESPTTQMFRFNSGPGFHQGHLASSRS